MKYLVVLTEAQMNTVKMLTGFYEREMGRPFSYDDHFNLSDALDSATQVGDSESITVTTTVKLGD